MTASLRKRAFRACATPVVGLAAVAIVSCRAAPRAGCDTAEPIRTHCGFENPEDLTPVPGGDGVIVSQMRRDGRGGALVAWAPGVGAPSTLWPGPETPGLAAGPAAGDPSCPPPAPEDFAPHGVFADASGLYVVNHGGRESVEIFRVEGRGESLSARWIGCVELPPGTSGNDVAVGPRGEIVVSNAAPPGGALRASLASLFGRRTGNVLLWRAGDGFAALPHSEASVANGVAFSTDGESVYYAESGAGRIVRLRLDGGERTEIPIPGRPDNLFWSRSGELLVASHLSFVSLALCLRRAPCRAPWAIFAVDPHTRRVRRVLEHDGSRIGAVASAVPVGDDLYLSAVFGDRIGSWTPEAGGAP